MDAEFWLRCWQQNQLGWQLDAPHPLLQTAPDGWLTAQPVFVPLCGKSPDLQYLAATAPVVGAELSELACKAFFSEQGFVPEIRSEADFMVYQHKNISLWQGDFFTLQPTQLMDCTRIYDRAALIALPAHMRKEYVRHLRRLIPQADMLLLSLEYPSGEKQGPPFSVPAAEIHHLFDFATVQLWQQRDLTGQGFARRRFDTSQLIESCWRIQWA